jgi:ESCRT-II complex subunit VPS36
MLSQATLKVGWVVDFECTLYLKSRADLQGKAQELVELAQRLSAKVQDDDDSAVKAQFDEYMLAMGIENPVTKSSHGSGNVRILRGQPCGYFNIGLADLLR